MRTGVGALRRNLAPCLPRVPEATRRWLTREVIAEAGLIAAAVAAILILTTALQLGLERYTIAGM